MASRRIYTPAEKAFVFAELEVSDGNIKRTARHSGIPVSTVRDWKKEWEEGGPPPEVEAALPAVIEDFTADAARIRDKALLELERQIEAKDVKAVVLVPAIGMLTDKIRLYQGLSTSRSESNVALPKPDEVRELFAGVLKEVVGSAVERRQTIEDAEWEPAEDDKPSPALSLVSGGN